MDRDVALDHVEGIIETVETEEMPVPVRELWVYGDVALGLDPIDRLDVYLTKDVLMRGDRSRAEAFEADYGVKGVGSSVRTAWAEAYPEFLRTSDNGYAAPEKCLAAHLLDGRDGEIHLEVCNASFDENVTQRLNGAVARDAYEEILDPRAVQLWVDGRRDETALARLRDGDLAFPTLPAALEMLGLDESAARAASETVRDTRRTQSGTTVRGDVV
jgi:hypothetical protein